MLTVRYRVGVIRGGDTLYDASVRHGADFLFHIDQTKYHPIDIFIDKKGVAHVAGVPVFLERTIPTLDLVCNTLFSEQLQKNIERITSAHEIPYIGSSLGSAYKDEHTSAIPHVKVPKRVKISKEVSDFEKEALALWKTFPKPLFVSSKNDSKKKIHPETFTQFLGAVAEAVLSGNDALLTEHIEGERIIIPVVQRMRGKEYFIPLSLHAHKNIDGLLRPLHQFNQKDQALFEETAVSLFKNMGLKRYAELEFSSSPRGLFFLGANQNPSLSPQDSFSFALSSVGITPKQFLDHVFTQALRGL